MPSDKLEALAAKVEVVLKDPALRARQLAVFAESLAFIHSHNPSLWLTHVLSDRIRFFAGRLIVMTLSGDTAWVTTDPQHDDQLSVLRSWKWDTGSYPRYKRPPSRNGFYRPSDDNNGQDWPVIQESHFAYLNDVLARTRSIDPRSAARHEPLMAEYLDAVLRPGALTSGWVAFEEIADHAGYWEGAMVRVSVNRFERDRSARDECLRRFGHKCAACEKSLTELYGPEVEGLVHVHHTVPLSQIREGYSPDPTSDLVPICPNCHAVVHAGGRTVRTVEDVRKMLVRTAGAG